MLSPTEKPTWARRYSVLLAQDGRLGGVSSTGSTFSLVSNIESLSPSDQTRDDKLSHFCSFSVDFSESDDLDLSDGKAKVEAAVMDVESKSSAVQESSSCASSLSLLVVIPGEHYFLLLQGWNRLPSLS